MNRVTRITDPLQGVTVFSYDPNGNLLSLTDSRGNVTSHTYDNMDRVSTRTDPLLHSESYQYDANGNVVQHTDRKGQVTSYTYDSLDQLTLVTHADGSTINYTCYETLDSYLHGYNFCQECKSHCVIVLREAAAAKESFARSRAARGGRLRATHP